VRRKCCFKRLEALAGVPDGAKCDSGEDAWKDSNNRGIEKEEEENGGRGSGDGGDGGDGGNGDGWWQRA